MNNIILVGFMGCGKSSVGKSLSEKLERKLIDTDEVIEEGEEKKITEIFNEKGEEAFRKIETKYLNKIRQSKNCIISTGGGIVLDPQNVEKLKMLGTVVFLHSPYEQLIENLEKSEDRPLLKNGNYKDIVRELLEKRESIYFESASIIIQTADKSINDIAEEIINLL